MALPTTVSTIEDIQGYSGPFLNGSDVYVILFSSSADTIHAFKATDPTSSFTEQDTGNRPDEGSLIEWYDAIQDGTTLHIGYQMGTGGSRAAKYVQFDMSNDTWGTVETAATPNAASSIQETVGLVVRSDGTVVMGYKGEAERVMGTDYNRVNLARRSTGGSWTAAIDVSGLGKVEEHETVVKVVRGDATNDRVHLMYGRQFENVRYSTYLSNNTFGHQDTIADSTVLVGSSNYMFGRSISFDDSGTIKVRFAVIDDGDTDNPKTIGFDDGDSPGAGTLTEITTRDILFGTGDVHQLSLAADGAVQHALYSDANADKVFTSKTGDGDDIWEAETEQLSVAAIGQSCANIYTRSGSKVLAFIYDDSAIKYDEITLSGGADVTGSGSPTAQSPTSSGSATRVIPATGSPSASSPTSSGTGSRIMSGSGSPSAQSPTSSGAATRVIPASGSPSASSPTSSGAATRVIPASGSPTAASPTASGAATRIVTASGTPAAPDPTASGAATRVIPATGTPSASSPTSSGTGSRVMSGSGSPTAASPTSSAAATRVVTGTSSPTAGSPTASGSGGLKWTATGSPTAGSPSASGTGEITKTATGSPTAQAASSSGGATIIKIGSGSPSAQSPTASGAATRVLTVTGNVTPQSPTADGSGTVNEGQEGQNVFRKRHYLGIPEVFMPRKHG